MQAKQQSIYRIVFTQEDKIYEIYSQFLSEESLMGFIEIEELVFSETLGGADTSEERLKAEFENVKRCYIPMHLVLRIDEMNKEGTPKVKENESKDNVRHFPGKFHKPEKK